MEVRDVGVGVHECGVCVHMGVPSGEPALVHMVVVTVVVGVFVLVLDGLVLVPMVVRRPQ